MAADAHPALLILAAFGLCAAYVLVLYLLPERIRSLPRNDDEHVRLPLNCLAVLSFSPRTTLWQASITYVHSK